MDELCFVVAAVVFARLAEVLGYEPSFDVPIVNVTVVTGQTAMLPCSIEYLGKYKVAWLDSKSIPLTYEDRRVIDDFRFSIVRPYVREWNLQIRDIKRDDQGQYRCTINTNPVKSKVVMLHVKVPASIIDELSSDDLTAQEGDTVVLVCNVTGVPKPEVTWSRRSASGKTSVGESAKRPCDMRSPHGSGPEISGETVVIQNVSRFCDDTYECIASNGVPPAVSRQVRVTVEFKPEISLPTRRLGQVKGRETILECVITAFPQATVMWRKEGRAISKSSRHGVEAYDEGDNALVLSLRITTLEATDYGEYECFARNPLGEDSKTMVLYEYLELEDKQRSSDAYEMRTTGVYVEHVATVFGPRSAAAAATKTIAHKHPSKNKQYSGPISLLGMLNSAASAHVPRSVLHRKWYSLPVSLVLTTLMTRSIAAQL